MVNTKILLAKNLVMTVLKVQLEEQVQKVAVMTYQNMPQAVELVMLLMIQQKGSQRAVPVQPDRFQLMLAKVVQSVQWDTTPKLMDLQSVRHVQRITAVGQGQVNVLLAPLT